MKRRRKTVNRAAWTSSIYSRTGKAPGMYGVGQQLKNAKEEHDALEEAICKAVLKAHKIELLKADAEAAVFRNPDTGKRYWKGRVKSGMPDRIWVCPPTGRFIGFEVKTNPDDKGRKNQKQLHRELMAAGAAVFVVHSIPEALQFVKLCLEMEAEKARIIEAARVATFVKGSK